MIILNITVTAVLTFVFVMAVEGLRFLYHAFTHQFEIVKYPVIVKFTDFILS